MSIIREIKAAWRWVFNIKDEVEFMPVKGDKFVHEIKVLITKVDSNYVHYRMEGFISELRLNHQEFNLRYRKIS